MRMALRFVIIFFVKGAPLRSYVMIGRVIVGDARVDPGGGSGRGSDAPLRCNHRFRNKGIIVKERQRPSKFNE